MSVKKYIVTLTEGELDDLKQLLSKGKVSARKITHAQILLHANENASGGGLKGVGAARQGRVFQRVRTPLQ